MKEPFKHVHPNTPLVLTEEETALNQARITKGWPKFTDTEIWERRGYPSNSLVRTDQEVEADAVRSKSRLAPYTDEEIIKQRKEAHTWVEPGTPPESVVYKTAPPNRPDAPLSGPLPVTKAPAGTDPVADQTRADVNKSRHYDRNGNFIR